MVRLTMRDLDVEILEAEPVTASEFLGFRYAPQPADPFDGLGDFEIHPAVIELQQERAARQTAELKLANVVAILDRPLSKLKVKDLKVLIGAAQDALTDEREQMG